MFNRFTTFALRRCSHVGRRAMCESTEKPLEVEQQRTGGIPLLTGERGINKVVLIGRVGRSPEVRGSTEHTATIFPLATSQTYRMPDGSYKQYTDWHRIVIFKKALGSVMAQKIGKGDRVYIAGSVTYSKFKVDDRTHTVPQIRADDVIVLEKKYSRDAEIPVNDSKSGESDKTWDNFDEEEVASK